MGEAAGKYDLLSVKLEVSNMGRLPDGCKDGRDKDFGRKRAEGGKERGVKTGCAGGDGSGGETSHAEYNLCGHTPLRISRKVGKASKPRSSADLVLAVTTTRPSTTAAGTMARDRVRTNPRC